MKVVYGGSFERGAWQRLGTRTYLNADDLAAPVLAQEPVVHRYWGTHH